MGCTASKLDNEDTVRRCKDRRRLMKEAVHARHHLAAAHADYCRSLRLTGSALSSFASFEPLSVSDQTPAVFLHPKPSPPPPTKPQPKPKPKPSSIPTRVPSSAAPPVFSPSPAPSPTIASSKLPHILSASSRGGHRRGRKHQPKLPHILSESSPSSSPASEFLPTAYQANSTYSSTPSQASSIWNWENFYPPSPPDSEFFNSRAAAAAAGGRDKDVHSRRGSEKPNDSVRGGDFNSDEEEGSETEVETETETERSEYDFFHSKAAAAGRAAKHHHDFTETEREEVQCSEWGDHYSTTSSSDEGDRDSRSEISAARRSNFGSSRRAESVAATEVGGAIPPAPVKYSGTAASSVGKATEEEESFRYYGGGGGEISDMKLVVRHKDLKEIVESIEQNFEKAAAAGDEVSKMLEIGREQLDRSFRQLKSKN